MEIGSFIVLGVNMENVE